MSNKNSVVEKMDWSLKEFILMLILTFILVPFFLEYLFNEFFSNLFQNKLYTDTLTGLIMAIVFLLGVYHITLKPFQLTWKDIGLRSFTKRYWVSTIFWTITLIVLSVVVVIIMDVLGISYENSKTESFQTQLTPINFTIGFISAAVISPFYEEVFYRGFLYKWLRSRFGIAVAIAFSSLIFMLVHIPTYNTLPINFISGLIFAWTYERSGSIVPGIIIHGCFNGIAVILTALA
ncbi:type II CAAX endopeptidase family protein [Bacillus sp. DX1.1]|nr:MULTISPECIES: type II CAAX endopeptidase family protein [unclassified Bacillus (in: firmicutes)]MDM5154915.1 type II CAAX endopeptidase family protein [Bacillus sp. DX1.1]WJE84075.1 type II CAAX endopeptidase family protein [Bacillus sp. DX3.1]